MNETPMLFPMAPAEFWKQIKTIVAEVMTEKLRHQNAVSPPDLMPQKMLLKVAEVCTIFQVSKPTLYDWIRQKKLRSFKIRSRRFFTREDIENLIRNKGIALNDSHIH